MGSIASPLQNYDYNQQNLGEVRCIMPAKQISIIANKLQINLVLISKGGQLCI